MPKRRSAPKKFIGQLNVEKKLIYMTKYLYSCNQEKKILLSAHLFTTPITRVIKSSKKLKHKQFGLYTKHIIAIRQA